MFLSYLWGIEIRGNGYACIHVKVGSYRTYDELKSRRNYELMSTNVGFLSYLWGIEIPLAFIQPLKFQCSYRTYEELKLSRFCSSPPPIMGSYRTYEELKSASLKTMNPWERVLIVPMRNWKHQPWASLIAIGVKFLSYLWGIESRSGSVGIDSCHGSYRTYEELKVCITSVRKTGWISFLSYLWGIERQVRRQYSNPSYAVLIVPMRNWKTYFQPIKFM